MLSIRIKSAKLGSNLFSGSHESRVHFLEFVNHLGKPDQFPAGELILSELDTIAYKIRGTFYASNGAVSISKGTFNLRLTSLFCPVEYEVRNVQIKLENTWNFVGFYDAKSNQTSPPLCIIPTFLKFTSDNGISVFNSFGTFEIINDSTLVISSLGGDGPAYSGYIRDYQERIKNALSNKEVKYQIHNNVLGLKYNNTGDKMIFYN